MSEDRPVQGRLNFDDLDSPQAMPPIARAERAHRRALGQVHSELRNQLHTPPGSPEQRAMPRRMGTPESYQGLFTPEDASRTTPSSRSSPISDSDMADMLIDRLEEAMTVIRMQKKLLKEQRLAAIQREAALKREHDVKQRQAAEAEEKEAATEQRSRTETGGADVVQNAAPNAQPSAVTGTQSTVTDATLPVGADSQHGQQLKKIVTVVPTPDVTRQPLQSTAQVTSGAAASQVTEKSPKLKDIHCRRFDGKEEYPGLGAGLEDFVKEFEAAIRMERLLNKSTWSTELKASVFGTFLEGQAARAYHDFVGSRDISYEELMGHFKKEFGCRLTQYELSRRMDTAKRSGDTWREYTTYLKYIERLMDGDQSQLLLETVCNNACPEIKATLLSAIDTANTNYMQELEKVVDLLIRLKGDGRRVGQTKQGGKSSAPPRQQQQQQNARDDSGSNKKQARNQSQGGQQQGVNQQQHQHGNQKNKQQIGGQKKNANGQANSTRPATKCWNCGESGHKEASCPAPKKASQQGSAHQAIVRETRTDDDSDGVAEVWMAAATSATESHKMVSWLVDSGASHHMCARSDILLGTSPSNLSITVANGGTLCGSLKGSCVIHTGTGNTSRVVLLHEVHFVPGLERNLLSVTELGEHGITCTFNKTQCQLTNRRGNIVATAERDGNLWVLNGDTVATHEDGTAMLAEVSTSTLQHWHERLGHVNFQDLLRMYNSKLTDKMDVTSKKLRFCLPCAEAKQTKSAQPTIDTSTSAPTDEIGAVLGVDLKTDITPDRNGNKHLLTIVDYGSSYNKVYLLQSKDEAADKLIAFIAEFERQFDVKVKVVRADGGGEFQGRELVAFFKRHGIKQQLTLPNTSASNGKVERMHRTLMDAARAMLWASTLPDRYWGDAVKYASYIRNRLPTRANSDYRAPMDVLTGKPPKVNHILKFGSTCTTHISHKKAASVKRRAEKALIIGINETKKGYKLLIPRTKKIVISADIQNIDKLDIRDPETQETLSQLNGENATPATDTGPATSAETQAEHTQSDLRSRKRSQPSSDASDSGEDEYAGHPISAGTLRRVFGARKRAKPSEFSLPPELIKEVSGSATLVISSAMAAMVTPKSIEEAMKTPEWPQWKAAIEKELADLQANGTWEVVTVPVGAKLVSSKWVFRIKFGSRGELERFKARLVARGFTQQYGIDFEETYSPVLKIVSLRFLAALASQWRRKLRQGDVPNAYVKADLDRPILMKPPRGSPDAQSDRTAWLLLKSLYGLKQSGLLWNKEINSFLLSLGFVRSKLDPCLYFRRHEGKLSVLGLYVDDVVVVSQEEAASDWVMEQLQLKFNIKDMGVAAKCLGISIEHRVDSIILHQRDNIEELLTSMGMADCKPARTPMDVTKAFDDDLAMEQTAVMRKIIGSLLWISNCTRPDITAAVNYFARFVARPRQSHWQGVKRVLRYLRGTSSYGLKFKLGQGVGVKWTATIFTDADWAGDASDAKSVSIAVLVLNGMVIGWASKKQQSVALSTMEAEYVAAAMATKDSVWIKQLLVEIGLWTAKEAVMLQVDNQSAIKFMTNDVTSQRSKHINIKFHFVRDVIKRGDVIVRYCPTQQQLADVMTKPLQRVIFERLRMQLHVVPVA